MCTECLKDDFRNHKKKGKQFGSKRPKNYPKLMIRKTIKTNVLEKLRLHFSSIFTTIQNSLYSASNTQEQVSQLLNTALEIEETEEV